MILHAIELTHVGRFRDTVRIGPFAPGLNILSAPNESGKTTALHATARALFDRHTTKDSELKTLRPVGTDLAPRIAVEFETREGRYRIEKTFLEKPLSHLHRQLPDSASWELIAEADAADQRTQTLLQSSLPKRGASNPEHWGLLSFLWARQGDPAAWPALHDTDIGQRIRSRLARIELDPTIEKLTARLDATATAIITPNGKSRANGPLATAEQDLATIETELATLRKTRADLETTHQRYNETSAQVAQLETEHTERERTAATLREQTLATERLRGELTTRQQALDTAQEKLTALTNDTTTLTRLNEEIATTRARLADAELTTQTTVTRLIALRDQLEQQHLKRPAQETRLQKLRDDTQRLQNLLKLRQLTATAATLARQLSKASDTAAEIETCETAKQKLPPLTPAKLRKLEELAQIVRDHRAQLQALGLTVELTPAHNTEITLASASDKNPSDTETKSRVLAAGKTETFRNPQTLDLHLANWGRITIRSGSQETQNAAAQLTEAETALAGALEAATTPNLDSARAALTTRQDLDTRLKTARATLATQLGDHDTIDALSEAAATSNRRAETLATTLQPTPAELARTDTDLETDEARLTETIPAEERALKKLDRELDQLRTDERSATQAVTAAEKSVHEHHARQRTLETQIADLTARHANAGGLAAAKTAAQLTFAQAEARVVATKADLPPDYEKLPDRNRRAAAALQQLANDLAAKRAERDQARGTLEALGGQGIYTRETELEEKKTEATLRRDAARTQAWIARLTHDLIERRKQAATKALLTPLEDRLTTAFAELTGDSTRRVYLDEHLKIAGIGRTREETYPFESLSQGAREQLLLCLRLAVAQELATDEPQILILDDVLVNTDPIRQERILDTLAAQSTNLQLLILTCHPDRYRGAGHPVYIK